jgi:hypothetical protein
MCIKRFWSFSQNNLLLNLFFSLKLVLEHRSPISQIPNEILLRLFTYYLNPHDLFSVCNRVNKQWKNIINDPTIWKIVNPINWARGKIRDRECGGGRGSLSSPPIIENCFLLVSTTRKILTTSLRNFLIHPLPSLETTLAGPRGKIYLI